LSVAQIAYSLHAARAQGSIDAPPFQHWLVEGVPWATFHRLASSYLVRFPALADFEISGDARHVQAYPNIDVSESTLLHLYLNQILPLAMSQQGVAWQLCGNRRNSGCIPGAIRTREVHAGGQLRVQWHQAPCR
jgi:hypothetical protein